MQSFLRFGKLQYERSFSSISAVQSDRSDPLKKFGWTRATEGHVLNENLWWNVQKDVIEYKVLLRNLLKTFTFKGFFLVICQTRWRIPLFVDCFLTFIWPLKVIKTLFTYFNIHINSKSSLDCNMTRIQSFFPRGDTALC